MSKPPAFPAIKSRFWVNQLLIGLAVVSTLIGWLPVISLVSSLAIADWAGCSLNEGNQYPCVVDGRDIGGWLETGLVLGWAALLSWPFVIAGIVLGIIALARGRHDIRMR